MGASAALGDGLSPLTPIYDEEHHASYVAHLCNAITNDPPVHNIALAGAYGTGKSSILQGVKKSLLSAAGCRARSPLIEVSLSNLNEPPEKVTEASGESSLSAVLQKEVVKRLLYSQNPNRLTLSRFKRIAEFRWGRALIVASVVTVILCVILCLIFGPPWISQYFENRSIPLWFGVMLSSFVSFATLFVVQYVMHRHAVLEVSIGAASIKISGNAGSYFDQYLDEMIYFFKQTRTRYVFFEDLDRFNDANIFRALRDLNAILNASQVIKQDVVFVYAVRDSLFEPAIPVPCHTSGAPDVSESPEPSVDSPAPMATRLDSARHKYGVSSPASDRSKFFDLIIPIVPFISPEVSASLLLRELNEKHIEDDARPSTDLIALAGRYFTDMRVVRSIANEYQVYAKELLGKTDVRGLHPDNQLAMVLYKHAHLADYEKIRSGESKLDQVAQKAREVMSDRLKAIDERIAQLRTEATAASKVKGRSETMGERLHALLQIGSRATGYSAEGPVQLEPGGRIFQWEELKTEAFWAAYATEPGSLRPHHANRTRVELSRGEIERFIDKASSISAWQSHAQKEVDDRVQALGRLRARNVASTFTQRVTDRSLWDSKVSEEVPDLPTCVHETLGDGLALELLRAGYIDNNFALYASVYHGDLLSADARSFMLQVMDQHETAPDFKLSEEDVEAILKQPGYDFLRTRSALNISVFEHLIDDDRLDSTVQRIVASTLDMDNVFVTTFLARSKAATKLVERLSPIFDKILVVIAENEQLEPEAKLQLLSTALAHLTSKADYAASDATVELIAGNIDSLPVILEDLSAERSIAFAQLLSQNSIKLASVEQMYEGTRESVVEANAFEINLQNLLVITPIEEQVGIDTLSGGHDSLVVYLLENAETYLGALESAEVEVFSVDNPERLPEILPFAAELENDSLDRLLMLAHPDATVEHFTDAPERSWPNLARTKRFSPTALNLVTYLKREDHNGSYSTLARSLATTSALLSVNEVSDDDKTELAVWLVNQEQVPSPVKLRLLSQLDLSDPLPLAKLQVNDGQLLAELISARRIGDTAETFMHFSFLPWDQKELALAGSVQLSDFVTHVDFQSDEFVGIVQSNTIRRAAKAAVLTEVNSLQGRGVLTKSLATVLADYAIAENHPVPDGNLSTLAAKGAPPTRIAKLLGKDIESRTDEGILSVLSQLHGEYRKLAAADGKKPRLEADDDVRRLLDRLKEMNLVSDYKEETKNGKYLRVFMRRHKR